MDDTTLINATLVGKSIGFHGQPLQKIWEGERGDIDLLKIGVVNPDYSAYQLRQKHFTFQNRAKRLRLHQFIAKNANTFFRSINDDFPQTKIPSNGSPTVIPPYDYFFSEKMDKSQRLKHIYSIGDIIYGTIHNKVNSGMFVKILCTGEPTVRLLGDLSIRAFLPISEAIPAIDRKGTQRSYITNDNICCELIEKNDDSDKLVISMRGVFNPKVQFGLVTYDHFPALYKSSSELKQDLYEHILEDSPEFRNPNCTDSLFEKIGLNCSRIYTNMSGLNGKFPAEEYGSEIRQVQASKWAFRSVAEGIEHFKLGRHTEAFQCLNKALNIDPRNVEGLVARGALFANSGSFKKAVDDFDSALKLNPGHANARRYKGETLVALGRSYEEENKIDDAMKAYQNCLTVIPRHEEAQKSLDFLRSKKAVTINSKQLIEPNELTLPALNLKIAEQNRDPSTSKKDADQRGKEKKSKKKKSKNRKRRNSSSSSSSDSSDSSDSSSGSDSDSSDSTSSTDSEKSKKKGRSRKDKRVKSLSPLSKRMALLPSPNIDLPPNMRNFNESFAGAAASEPDEYEARVRKFLELTRDEENFEEKVRKCVEDTNKYRERKLSDEKSKKKDKKKNRKMKKDSKKRKKDKKSKSLKRSKDDIDNLDKIELREALKIITASIPGFDVDATKASNKLDVIEKSLSAIKESHNKLPKSGSYLEKEEGNKWSMMFAKDDKKANVSTAPVATTSKDIPKQTPFGMDDDSETEVQNRYGHNFSITQAAQEKNRAQSTTIQPSSVTSTRPKYIEPPQQLPKPPARQAVLDKFGNFRLPSTEKPPEPTVMPRSRSSRSRTRSPRRRYSRSRSRSISVKRRSRSRSYRRRSRSRSYRSRSGGSRSRSFSRSRSRSGSLDRYRRPRGRGGYDRGTYYKPRFGFGNGRGRGRGGYRDFRDYRDFRGRGRDRNRGWGNGNGSNRGGRFRSRERRFDRRSRSRSYDSDRDRKRSPMDRKSPIENDRSNKSDRKTSPAGNTEGNWNKGIEANVAHDIGGEKDVSLEEIEKIIEKGKKEKKEDMIERNKDLVKKSSNW